MLRLARAVSSGGALPVLFVSVPVISRLFRFFSALTAGAVIRASGARRNVFGALRSARTEMESSSEVRRDRVPIDQGTLFGSFRLLIRTRSNHEILSVCFPAVGAERGRFRRGSFMRWRPGASETDAGCCATAPGNGATHFSSSK